MPKPPGSTTKACEYLTKTREAHHVYPYLGRERIAEVSREQIYTHLVTTLPEADATLVTRRAVRTVLSSMLQMAWDEQYRHDNPVITIKLKKVPSKPVLVSTHAQWNRLEGALPFAYARLNVTTDLLDGLQEVGAHEQAAALAARAAHASLDNPMGVARLLGSLRKVGAHEQAAALAARAASHVSLSDSDRAVYLLHTLREVGAGKDATILAARLPAVGMFGFFLTWDDYRDRFRFGRNADGTPATSWGWEDLGLRVTWSAKYDRRLP